MSIPDVGLGHSFAHRVIAQVAVSSLGLRFVRDLGARIDPTLMRLTGGRVSCVWPFPAVLVSHVGARTGISRTNAVVYFTDQGRVVLIPSNFGSARNPAWYHNVKANPIVELYGRGSEDSSSLRRFTAKSAIAFLLVPKAHRVPMPSMRRSRAPRPGPFPS